MSPGKMLFAVIRQLTHDKIVDPVRHHIHGDADGIREPEIVGAAVAFHHDAVEAEEGCPVIAARIDSGLHLAEAALGEQVGQPGHDRAAEGLAQIFAVQPDRALDGLQHDIAGEAVDHEYVDRARADIVALDEAMSYWSQTQFRDF